MKEFILVPSSEYALMTAGSHNIKTPLQITEDVAIPEHSLAMKISEIHDAGVDSLDKKNATPEMTLKLYNYFQNMYRNVVKHTDMD